MIDNLYIVPFKQKHLADLTSMHAKRDNALGIDQISMRELPKVGYVAYLGDTIVAAGFMRRVEPNYAQFDTFMSDPFFGSEVRNEALEKIVRQLTEDARSMKIKGILAFTKDEGIFTRAIHDGFSFVDQSILVKRL